jgi:hypothetical protein
MHDIEPYYNWIKYYDSASDERSPFFGKEYNYDLYQDTIYGFYIDPGWDSIESDTLYVKILFTDYEEGFTIIEFLGEWNDAITNDIMLLRRNLLRRKPHVLKRKRRRQLKRLPPRKHLLRKPFLLRKLQR